MTRVPDDALLVVWTTRKFPWLLFLVALFLVAGFVLVWFNPGDPDPQGNCYMGGKYGFLAIFLCPLFNLFPLTFWAAIMVVVAVAGFLNLVVHRRKKRPMVVATEQSICFDFHGDWVGPIAWAEIKRIGENFGNVVSDVTIYLVDPDKTLERFGLSPQGNRSFLGVAMSGPDLILPGDEFDRASMDVVETLESLRKSRT